MKKLLSAFLLTSCLAFGANAEKYNIDSSHAFVHFKVSHLGYSWVIGTFKNISGNFDINREDLPKSSVEFNIDITSVDTSHAERDKHLRGEEFLNIDEYKSAKFVSNSIHIVNDTTAKVNGELTFLGVTKKITVQVTLVGEGKDPWGGYRIGFEGMSSFAMKDFDMKRDLGDKSQKVDVFFSVEGIRAAE